MVYSDVVTGGRLLPEKTKYTKKDFDELVSQGVPSKEARFICICSAVHYNTGYSKVFNSRKMLIACGIA